MAPIERANGRRPGGLSHLLQPALRSVAQPVAKDLDFDLDQVIAAVRPLSAEVPSDAFTSSFLGSEREGSAILIDDEGLVLTIGYLIVEAHSVTLMGPDDRPIAVEILAYDYDTGFGLLRTLEPLDVPPMEIGSSATLAERDKIVIAAQGGRGQAMSALVVSKREFAGYWEYLLDEAIFTAPPHPAWSGAALIGSGGKLLGVGSLFLEDVLPARNAVAGNMFVPIDLLGPILPALVHLGRTGTPPHPWLGMFSTEADARVLVSGVAPDGPADGAGVRPGDVILRVSGAQVASIGEMYRKIWAIGDAGVHVPLTVSRDGEVFELVVRSGDRNDLLILPRRQ